MEAAFSDILWEGMYAPYDQATYQAVLEQLSPNDIILDIGAGDLRLARQMAQIVRKVYAVEVNAQVLNQAHAFAKALPANLIVSCADACALDFPTDITTGVLLMRHCTCFRLYVDKLRGAGATRLVTNARWRMDVEVVDLGSQRISYPEAGMGWYACLCGGIGFKEGPAEGWSIEMDRVVNEVSSCPRCIKNMSFSRRDTPYPPAPNHRGGVRTVPVPLRDGVNDRRE